MRTSPTAARTQQRARHMAPVVVLVSTERPPTACADSEHFVPGPAGSSSGGAARSTPHREPNRQDGGPATRVPPLSSIIPSRCSAAVAPPSMRSAQRAHRTVGSRHEPDHGGQAVCGHNVIVVAGRGPSSVPAHRQQQTGVAAVEGVRGSAGPVLCLSGYRGLGERVVRSYRTAPCWPRDGGERP